MFLKSNFYDKLVFVKSCILSKIFLHWVVMICMKEVPRLRSWFHCLEPQYATLKSPRDFQGMRSKTRPRRRKENCRREKCGEWHPLLSCLHRPFLLLWYILLIGTPLPVSSTNFNDLNLQQPAGCWNRPHREYWTSELRSQRLPPRTSDLWVMGSKLAYSISFGFCGPVPPILSILLWASPYPWWPKPLCHSRVYLIASL